MIGPDVISYASVRHESKWGQFIGQYRAVSEPAAASPGTLEAFLVERYCLFTTRENKVLRCDIHHLPWPLQSAAAEIRFNTMAEAAGIDLPSSAPVLHYASDMDVLVWSPVEEKVG